MGKTKKAKEEDRSGGSSSITRGGVSKKKRIRREVEVVVCPNAFPISREKTTAAAAATATTVSRDGKREVERENSDTKAGGRIADSSKEEAELLDWDSTAKEIRQLGATGFRGQQKKNFEEEQYKLLTGREKKKESVPLKVRRSRKQKARERYERQVQGAKKSGVVLPAASGLGGEDNGKKNRKKQSVSRIHGPAPSIGFMSKGVFRLKGKPK